MSTLLALLVLSVCAAAVLLHAPARPVPSIHRHAPLASRGLLSLPGALRGPASQTLGAQDPAYHAVTVPGGLRIVNPAQRLSARFEASGVRVHAGKLGLGLTLARAGYGSRLATVGAATPAARANRITYDRGWIEEWYTNGPVGLEQGFTIPRGPGGAARGPLQLALSLSGGARATGLPGGEGIRFSARHASLVYGAPSAKDALGHPLRSWLQLQAGQVLLHVDTRRAVYPVRIDPFIQQGSKMTAGEIGAGQFGVSVALSADGNTALVGASNDNGGIGAVWVFVRSGGAWAEQGEKLTGAEETGKGEFGSSVALAAEGNTAVIAGWKDNGDRGAAWVFTRSNGVWSQQGSKITPTGESGAGKFGVSVAVSSEGDTALIGGHVDNNFLGAVWVFTRSGGVWSQQGEKLTGSGEVGKGGFGQSVALSSDGNTALVGAYHDNNFLGAAWVFTRSAGVWSQQGEKLTGGGEEEGQAWLGNAVALSSDGNTALIGGYHDNGELGAAWVFTRSAGVWSQQGKKLTGGEESAGGTFATSVALSADGNTALMGGYNDSVEKGAAWVFLR
ncbi:MAG TPA: FG-GAP repeat protein, partial [Solirubrobacteraceae bacterium]